MLPTSLPHELRFRKYNLFIKYNLFKKYHLFNKYNLFNKYKVRCAVCTPHLRGGNMVTSIGLDSLDQDKGFLKVKMKENETLVVRHNGKN